MNTVIVAGLTRSGLSLTMQMLCAGGYPCKGEPPAFECYSIGEIPWDQCSGYAVKSVDTQLEIPPDGDYRVILLRRNMEEQAKSMNKFMGAFGVLPMSILQLTCSFQRDYEIIYEWASNYPTMVLDFEKLVTEPLVAAASIQEFIGVPLNRDSMAECVIERGPECHPTLLEFKLLEDTEIDKELTC